MAGTNAKASQLPGHSKRRCYRTGHPGPRPASRPATLRYSPRRNSLRAESRRLQRRSPVIAQVDRDHCATRRFGSAPRSLNVTVLNSSPSVCDPRRPRYPPATLTDSCALKPATKITPGRRRSLSHQQSYHRTWCGKPSPGPFVAD